MQEVKSNMLSHMAHDPETKTLRVRFKNGGKEYEYQNVTAEEHAAILAAPSIGKHFRDTILSRGAGSQVKSS